MKSKFLALRLNITQSTFNWFVYITRSHSLGFLTQSWKTIPQNLVGQQLELSTSLLLHSSPIFAIKVLFLLFLNLLLRNSLAPYQENIMMILTPNHFFSDSVLTMNQYFRNRSLVLFLTCVPDVLPKKIMMITKMQFINNSTCSRPYMYNISYNPHNSLMRPEPPLLPFCTGRNRGTERSSNLPGITRLQSGMT